MSNTTLISQQSDILTPRNLVQEGALILDDEMGDMPSLTVHEELVLEATLNFVTVFQQVYPFRRPPFVILADDRGIERVITQFVRPSPMKQAYFSTLSSTASFLSSYLTLTPSAHPTLTPDHARAPATVLASRGGTALELAILGTSILIGSGFDAAVAVGYASRRLTEAQFGSTPAPATWRAVDDIEDPIEAAAGTISAEKLLMGQYTGQTTTTKPPAQPTIVVQETTDETEKEDDHLEKTMLSIRRAAAAAAAAVAAAAAAANDTASQQPLGQRFYVSASEHLTDPPSAYDQYKAAQALRISRGEDALTVQKERSRLLREAAATAAQPPATTTFTDFDLPEDHDDQLFGRRMHAWVVILNGPRNFGLEDPDAALFWDVATGLVTPVNGATKPADCPTSPAVGQLYFGIESIFNHRNSYSCVQDLSEGICGAAPGTPVSPTDPATWGTNVNFQLLGPAWEPLFTTPERERARQLLTLAEKMEIAEAAGVRGAAARADLLNRAADRCVPSSVANLVADALTPPSEPTPEIVHTAAAAGVVAASILAAVNSADAHMPEPVRSITAPTHDELRDLADAVNDATTGPFAPPAPFSKLPTLPQFVDLFPSEGRERLFKDCRVTLFNDFTRTGLVRAVVLPAASVTVRVTDKDNYFLKTHTTNIVRFDLIQVFDKRSDKLRLRRTTWESRETDLSAGQIARAVDPFPENVQFEHGEAVCVSMKEYFMPGRPDSVATVRATQKPRVMSVTLADPSVSTTLAEQSQLLPAGCDHTMTMTFYPGGRTDGLVKTIVITGDHDQHTIELVYVARPDRLARRIVRMSPSSQLNGDSQIPTLVSHGVTYDIHHVTEHIAAPSALGPRADAEAILKFTELAALVGQGKGVEALSDPAVRGMVAAAMGTSAANGGLIIPAFSSEGIFAGILDENIAATEFDIDNGTTTLVERSEIGSLFPTRRVLSRDSTEPISKVRMAKLPTLYSRHVTSVVPGIPERLPYALHANRTHPIQAREMAALQGVRTAVSELDSLQVTLQRAREASELLPPTVPNPDNEVSWSTTPADVATLLVTGRAPTAELVERDRDAAYDPLMLYLALAPTLSQGEIYSATDAIKIASAATRDFCKRFSVRTETITQRAALLRQELGRLEAMAGRSVEPSQEAIKQYTALEFSLKIAELRKKEHLQAFTEKRDAFLEQLLSDPRLANARQLVNTLLAIKPM